MPSVTRGRTSIELGVPFSDPMADGPSYTAPQASDAKARNHSWRCAGHGKEFRTTDQKTPVVLMGYANPIERMTYIKFCARAKQAGGGRRVSDRLPARGMGIWSLNSRKAA